MVERQTRDLEVRVRVPVQEQIFLLKFDKLFIYTYMKIFVNRKRVVENGKTLAVEVWTVEGEI